MKFLHTADWHIGKKLNGFDLLEEQEAAFKELLAIAEAEAVDGIIIAGDLYDRSVPAVAAVAAFNEMLIELNLKHDYPIFAISGNHDSGTRLETGGPWFEQLNFHLHTRLEQSFTPIECGNVQLFLLPYFEPIQARQYFDDPEIRKLDEAMVQVVAEMKRAFKPGFQQVLVAHFFVAGSATTDSETKVTVGGLDNVPLSLLADFDYVALGHLHYKEAIKAANARYSGSLLKYSLSELKQAKGVYIVELDGAGVTFDFHEISPLRDLLLLEEGFETLMSPAFYETVEREAYIAISLTDRGVIPNVMQQLRTIYPRIIQLERAYGREGQAARKRSTAHLTQQNPAALFGDYFLETTGDPLSARQTTWLAEALSDLQREK